MTEKGGSPQSEGVLDLIQGGISTTGSHRPPTMNTAEI